MNQRRVAFFHNTDIDAVGSAFQDAFVDNLSGLEVFPDGLDVGIRKIGRLVLRRGRRGSGCGCSHLSPLALAIDHSE